MPETGLKPVLTTPARISEFPAGEVSSFNFRQREVSDPPWNPQIARLIRNTGAPVLPVFFNGCNSAWFQIAGLVHARLRTLLLPRELCRCRLRTIQVRIGSLITPQRLAQLNGDSSLITYLRLRTYNLRHGCQDRSQPSVEPSLAIRHPDSYTSGPPMTLSPPATARLEFEKLPASQILMDSREFMVVLAQAPQIPSLLQRIGHYRERCFRAVGEGTGRDIDLDLFDNYYQHLILWSKRNQEVAGAYRLGEVDRILPRFGIKGLYASTLFKLDPRLFQHLGPALELGRSFIRPAYQKQYAPLLLLWQGIGAFVARQPHYTALFGPVSISSAYRDVSRRYMVNYLKSRHYADHLARFVRPVKPFRGGHRFGRELHTCATIIEHLDDLSALIGDIEPCHKGVPVLLKHYLKIGGNLLGFNVDDGFNGALDALLVVKLSAIALPLLSRFMGLKAAQDYLQQHARECSFQRLESNAETHCRGKQMAEIRSFVS